MISLNDYEGLVLNNDCEGSENLKKELLSEFAYTNPKINFETTLSDLIQILGIKTELENELDNRLKIAPNPVFAIDLFIDECNEEMQSDPYPHYKDIGYKTISKGKNYNLQGIGYLFIDYMVNKYIAEGIEDLVVPFLGTHHALQDLAKGAFYAHFILYLKEEKDRYEKQSKALNNWQIQNIESTDIKINNSNTSRAKLNWTGNKNQLYYVLKQLKEQNLINNTLEELTQFIKENVIGFEDDKKTTISGAIGRKKTVAKNNRVNLDLDWKE